MNGVLRDLSFKHEPTFAVAWHGELLPVRFATESEAVLHLYGLETGHVLPVPVASTDYAVNTARRRAA